MNIENDYVLKKYIENVQFTTTAKKSNKQLQRDYTKFRKNSREFTQYTLVKKLINKQNIREAAKKLGLSRRGTLVFNDEDDTSILFDFILHNWYVGAKKTINSFYDKNNGPLSEVNKLILNAMNQSLYRVLVITETLPHSGIIVYDILHLEKLLLIDNALAKDASVGVLLSTNTLHFGDYVTTTGAGLVVNRSVDEIWSMIEKLRKKAGNKWRSFNDIPTKFRTKFVSTVIKKGLRNKTSKLDEKMFN